MDDCSGYLIENSCPGELPGTLIVHAGRDGDGTAATDFFANPFVITVGRNFQNQIRKHIPHGF